MDRSIGTRHDYRIIKLNSIKTAATTTITPTTTSPTASRSQDQYHVKSFTQFVGFQSRRRQQQKAMGYHYAFRRFAERGWHYCPYSKQSTHRCALPKMVDYQSWHAGRLATRRCRHQ